MVIEVLTLSDTGVWRLYLGRGVGKRPPYHSKHLWYIVTKKWIPTSYLAETKMFQQKNNQQIVCNMYN